jgi:hypothetical protein
MATLRSLRVYGTLYRLNRLYDSVPFLVPSFCVRRKYVAKPSPPWHSLVPNARTKLDSCVEILSNFNSTLASQTYITDDEMARMYFCCVERVDKALASEEAGGDDAGAGYTSS